MEARCTHGFGFNRLREGSAEGEISSLQCANEPGSECPFGDEFQAARFNFYHIGAKVPTPQVYSLCAPLLGII